MDTLSGKAFQPYISRQPAWKEVVRQYTPLGCLVVLCTALLYFVDCSGSVMSLSFLAIVTAAWATGTFELGRMLPAKDKAVLITGCDSGFGHWLAKVLDQEGVTVYAGCVSKDGEGAQSLKAKCSDRVHVLQMDVTDHEQVNQCLLYVRQQEEKDGTPELWGVVNNAGIGVVADIELTTMEQFVKLANINQLGMVRVTKRFLPLVRKTKGRIVNVTSVKGRVSIPFNGAYNMTKYAGETFSDILRLEMRKFGVGVSCVEPCNYGGATKNIHMPTIHKDVEEIWDGMDDELRQTYGRDYVDSYQKVCEDAIPTAEFNVWPVLEALTHALFAQEPRPRYLIAGGSGWIDLYKWRALLTPFLPEWLMDAWLLRDLEGYFPKPQSLL